MALECLDIPGARHDPALDASAADQSYGRLFPAFKSQDKAEKVVRKLPIDRLVGKRLAVKGGAGEARLALTGDGATTITVRTAGSVARHTAPSMLAGLDNAAYNGKLARTLFSLGIAWKDFAAPAVPAIDFGQIPATPTIASIARTTLELKGKPSVERSQTVDYACSSEAAYIGDPAQLSSVVVLKGTIRATQLTTTTTTDTVLDLTINDVVEQQSVSYGDLVALLGSYPE
ncbi:MAG: hypothetical protein HKN11_20130, partial [Rhizobiales bacterium]|nr:hypothetical protein [Hyphomicrobiales bacterium]